MTQTLTTELLSVVRAMRDYIDALPSDVVASLPTMPGFDRDWADEVIEAANREAQPVGEEEINAALRLHRLKVEGHSQLSDSFRAGFKYARRTAPPAPAYPETLPCAVRLMPGIIFGEGVRTSTMLDGLRRREEYNAEMAAMTPEQKNEQSAAIKALFSRMTLPEPAVPEEISAAIRYLKDTLVACNRFNYCADAVNRVESSCRAAMLAQPVRRGGKLPEGFKLMPIDMTDEIGEAIAMEARCCGGIALCIYEAALAAAPEGGD
ncbi:hypothetical protein [Serratia quinivorans]|uniref:hypothetical protein n=1 Tax=Serratia quinivorans TaxID=137545 RepID=UPI0034C6DDB4